MKKMTKEQYATFINDQHEGCKEAAEEMPDISIEDIVSDVAVEVLASNPEAGAYLKSLGVKDIEGRLADDIYSGI